MKTIGIYPGNFQPAHRGHVSAYRKLKQLTPDVYVVSTDKTPTPQAPLNFGEKEQILVRHGIPSSHVIKVESWKHPKEVYQHVSPENTNVIFMLNPKETVEVSKRKQIQKDGNTEKEVWVELDGTPSYFQPYKGNERNMESLSKHGYVIIHDDNIIDGKPITTDNIRDGIASKRYTPEQHKKFFVWVFGWFDIGLFQMISSKFKLAQKTVEPEISPDELKEMVNQYLDEVLGATPSAIPQSNDLDNDSDGLPGEEERASDVQKKRTDAVKQKAAAERALQGIQADVKWKEADLKRKKKDELPNKRKEIDQLNQAISSL